MHHVKHIKTVNVKLSPFVFLKKKKLFSLLFFICPLSPPTNEMYKGGGKEGGQKIEKKNKMMSAINRKQVPLCRDCHNLVHSGKYDGMSLKHYKVKK
jgi:hypothetical protein